MFSILKFSPRNGFFTGKFSPQNAFFDRKIFASKHIFDMQICIKTREWMHVEINKCFNEWMNIQKKKIDEFSLSKLCKHSFVQKYFESVHEKKPNNESWISDAWCYLQAKQTHNHQKFFNLQYFTEIQIKSMYMICGSESVIIYFELRW